MEQNGTVNMLRDLMNIMIMFKSNINVMEQVVYMTTLFSLVLT